MHLALRSSDLDIQKRLNAKGQANLGQLRNLGAALSAWAKADRGVTAKDLALSAQVPLTACRALCNQLEEAGLIARDTDHKMNVLVDTDTLAAAVEELTRRFATAEREDTRRLSAIADYANSGECRSVFIQRCSVRPIHRAVANVTVAVRAARRGNPSCRAGTVHEWMVSDLKA